MKEHLSRNTLQVQTTPKTPLNNVLIQQKFQTLTEYEIDSFFDSLFELQ